MLISFFEMLANYVFDFLESFFAIFPPMPFDTTIISETLNLPLVATVFGWVNYFLPLDVASSIVALWTTAIMAYVGLKLAFKYSKDLT